jgi:hypothetical protein
MAKDTKQGSADRRIFQVRVRELCGQWDELAIEAAKDYIADTSKPTLKAAMQSALATQTLARGLQAELIGIYESIHPDNAEAKDA